MPTAHQLTASLEDYLEAIFEIIQDRQVARAKEISERLGVSSSSVTGALHALSDRKLINHEPYGLITLTAKGKAAAEGVVDRHAGLHDFFVKVLGIDRAEADEVACRMEHMISPAILARLTRFVEFVEVCPRAGADWIEGFGYWCERGRSPERCDRCVDARLKGAERGEPSEGTE